LLVGIGPLILKRVGKYCDGSTAIKAVTAQGMGLGVVFEESLKAEVTAGKFIILKFRGLELEGESYVIYAKNRPLRPVEQKFFYMLSDEMVREYGKICSNGASRSKGSSAYSIAAFR
jgi:LysR substrate binding domain-containing protein